MYMYINMNICIYIYIYMYTIYTQHIQISLYCRCALDGSIRRRNDTWFDVILFDLRMSYIFRIKPKQSIVHLVLRVRPHIMFIVSRVLAHCCHRK